LNGQLLANQYDLSFDKDKVKLIDVDEDEAPVSGVEVNGSLLPADILNGIKLLDEEEFTDYLMGNGNWIFPSERYCFSYRFHFTSF
jgi:hypothetical protein